MMLSNARRTRALGTALREDDLLTTYDRDLSLKIGAAAASRPFVAPPLRHPVSSMMFVDFTMYLPDDILTKVDRMSMAVSLEARTPFLDQRVVELAWSLPLAMKIRHDRGKWILRELLRRFLPGTLVDREKQGFGLPLATWLRGPLREWAESLLRDLDASVFRDDVVRDLWRRHLAGENHEAELWTALTWQAWRATRP